MDPLFRNQNPKLAGWKTGPARTVGSKWRCRKTKEDGHKNVNEKAQGGIFIYQREIELKIGYVVFVLPIIRWQVYIRDTIRLWCVQSTSISVLPVTYADLLSPPFRRQLITHSVILIILVTFFKTTIYSTGLYPSYIIWH
jgi:hypothetical protein